MPLVKSHYGAIPQPVPAVSVVVPIYNGEEDLPDLVACLLAQTYPAERLEYWLVDNGSRDRTSKLLQMAEIAARDRGIRLRPLTCGAIQSSYGARNVGIRAAGGDVLVFTDVDCRPSPDWLSNLVPSLTDPAVGLVAGAIQALPSRHWLARYGDRQGTLSQHHTLAHPFLPYGQTANLAVRAKILRQVGLFRPQLTTGGDADLCWRIQQATPWRLVAAPDAVVYHRHRQSLPDLWRQWYRYGCSNRYLHELHGVALMRSLTVREIGYRLLRWALKDLPQATVPLVQGQGTAIELAIAPLDLWCAQARTQGQQQAHLPEAACLIEYLEAGESPCAF